MCTITNPDYVTNVLSLPQKLKVEPWSLHLTWIWGKQSGKLARLQEARMWRGEPPDSPWYGGSGGDKYLAMDLVQPQVGQQQKVPKTINPQELLQVPTTQVLMARRCAPFVLVRRHQRRQAPRHGPSAVTGAARGPARCQHIGKHAGYGPLQPEAGKPGLGAEQCLG